MTTPGNGGTGPISESDEHVVRGGRNRGLLGRRLRRGRESGEIRLMPAVDRVDGVIDSPLDHREVH